LKDFKLQEKIHTIRFCNKFKVLRDKLKKQESIEDMKYQSQQPNIAMITNTGEVSFTKLKEFLQRHWLKLSVQYKIKEKATWKARYIPLLDPMKSNREHLEMR